MQSKRLMAVFFAVALFLAGIAGPASAQQQQFGLVNVAVGDITFSDINIGAAIPIVIAACPNVAANVVVAAVLAAARGGQGATFGDCQAGPVTISQSQQ